MTRTEPVAADSIRSSTDSSIPCALLRRSNFPFLAVRVVSIVPFCIGGKKLKIVSKNNKNLVYYTFSRTQLYFTQ